MFISCLANINSSITRSRNDAAPLDAARGGLILVGMTKTKTTRQSVKNSSTRKSTRKMTKKSTSKKSTKKNMTRVMNKPTKASSSVTKRTPSNTQFMIEHKFEDSSFIKSFRWVANDKTNHQTGNMTVFFKDGNRYLYESFSKEMAMSWRRRKSAGTFFHSYVKTMNSKRV